MATIKSKALKTKAVKKTVSIPKKQDGGYVKSNQPEELKSSKKNIKKTLIKDPEGNEVLVKKNLRTGREVEIVTFADRMSSGAKKAKTVTRPLTREIRKANAFYEKYPKFAEEDSYIPISAEKGKTVLKGKIKTKMRNGGVVKNTPISKKVSPKKPSKLISKASGVIKYFTKKK